MFQTNFFLLPHERAVAEAAVSEARRPTGMRVHRVTTQMIRRASGVANDSLLNDALMRLERAGMLIVRQCKNGNSTFELAEEDDDFAIAAMLEHGHDIPSRRAREVGPTIIELWKALATQPWFFSYVFREATGRASWEEMTSQVRRECDRLKTWFRHHCIYRLEKVESAMAAGFVGKAEPATWCAHVASREFPPTWLVPMKPSAVEAGDPHQYPRLVWNRDEESA